MKSIAVIFDMDGVILDSEKVYQEIEREMFRELGIPVSIQEHREFTGSSERAMWQKMKLQYGFRENPDELVRNERQRFLNKMNAPGGIPAVEGSTDLIHRLHESGIPVLVASSSSREIIETVLQSLNISDCFQGIVSGDDVPHSKPAPDIFLKASELAAVPPSGCTVIEDSENGILAARSAGMKVIGLQIPGSGDLDLTGADRIVSNLNEINPDLISALS